MEKLIAKTSAPIVDLSWMHESSKLITGSQEDTNQITPLAMDSREKASDLPKEHKIVVVLN